jgi:3-hydroxyisobutyrate dehydrogenase-like beta-hydroxyacid dehydrogenase
VRVGLCGCGNMGSAIAARLSARFELRSYDVDPARAAAVATAVGEVADLAGDAVVLSLPNPAASRAIVEALVPALAPGAVIVETSTVAPADVRALEPACAAAGVHLVDAAILSGVPQMRDGTTALLVGGSDAAVAAAAPVLDALTARRFRLGPLGSGMAAKVANNAVSHAVMVILLEATALADASGVAPSVFAELLAEPDAGLLRPLAHRLRERVLAGDFEGGMPMDAARKDSVLALRLAQEAGIPLFAIQGAHTPYELALAAGLGREDYAALGRLWEAWTGRSFQEDR